MPQMIVWNRACEKPSHHGANPLGGGSFAIDEKNGQMHQTNIGRSNQAGRKAFHRRKSRQSEATSRLSERTTSLRNTTIGMVNACVAPSITVCSLTSGRNSRPRIVATITARCPGNRMNRMATTGNQSSNRYGEMEATQLTDVAQEGLETLRPYYQPPARHR